MLLNGTIFIRYRGDTIPIQKTKTSWVMFPVSYQRIRYAIPTQIQFQ